MNKKYCTFYLVRHGESEANAKGLRAGQADFDLTKKGIQQAKEIAQEFANFHFDAIYSSDLIRAKKTAEIIATLHNLPVTISKDIRERRWGENLEGRLRTETDPILKEFHESKKENRRHLKVFADMESDHEIVTRLTNFLQRVAKKNIDKTILIVSHANLITNFMAYLNFATHQQLQGSLKTTGYIKLHCDGFICAIEETHGLTLNPTKEKFSGS